MPPYLEISKKILGLWNVQEHLSLCQFSRCEVLFRWPAEPAAAACSSIVPVSMLCENTRVTQFTKVPILAETMATYCVKQGGVCLFLLHWINKQGGNPFVFEKTHAGQLSCCWATIGVGLQLTNCSQQGVKRSQFYLMFQSESISNPNHFCVGFFNVQN